MTNPTASDTEQTAAHVTGYGTRAYRSYVLCALLFVAVLNLSDRALPTILSEPIIEDLKISDTQFGLLKGLAFAVLYSFAGIPIAFLSETRSRVWVMTACIVMWSLATALMGLAYPIDIGGLAISGFAVMALCRMLVGIAESGCTPQTNSLIADYYPPAKRSTAVGFFAMGGTLGALAANLIGGPVNELLRSHFTSAAAAARGVTQSLSAAACSTNNLPNLTDAAAEACRDGTSMAWRGCFVLMGLVGVISAVGFKLTVKEPPRGYTDPPGAAPRTRATLRELIRVLAGKPTFWWMTAAATTAGFCTYGINTFQTSFVRRVHGFSQVEASLFFNIPSAVAASIGVLVTGWLVERMAHRHPNAITWLPALGLFLCAPLYLIGFSSDTPWVAIALVSSGAMVKYGYVAAQYAIVQGVVGGAMRATATAILLLALNLVGLGLGPVVAGGLSDLYFQMQVASAGLGELSRSQCRGLALAALSPEMRELCATADPKALRQAILSLAGFYVAPGILLLFAMRTLQRDLIKA
ncbi:spinster family MFS transporter [Phenylobacterium sp. VNQ135]|uniref:spinster family MFS transporter n=1 Tax=Phenylobacterium sp. VNQ135 TaxID=3400922 RepID=UPI003C0E1C75